MRTVEDILSKVFPGQTKVASDTSEDTTQEFDVGSFMEDLAKTADALDKAAEALPTTPELMASGLRMLDNPLGITRQEVHDNSRKFASPVLPDAGSSLQVPRTLDDVQPSGSYLRSRIGR